MTTLANLPDDLGQDRLLDFKQAAEFAAMSVPHFRRVSREWDDWVRIGERKKAISFRNLLKRINAKTAKAA